MPRLGVLNQFPRLILLSPFYGAISRRFLLFSYVGRKTGLAHEFPVAYVRRDRDLIMTTDDPWWHNFEGGAPVRICPCRAAIAGEAWAIRDSAEVEAALRDLIAAQHS